MLPILLDPAKFQDALLTAKGESRAHVGLKALETLWFNTGTLCNLTCRNCYIESSPRNDRLVYLTAAEVASYLDEIERDGHATRLIGFTGGEPFMNPELPAMLDDVLSRGFKAMVLTNAMKPMHKMKPALLGLLQRHGGNLTLRVSLDHYGRALHEAERGARSWKPTIDGLVWLAESGFDVHVAGRRFSDEPEDQVRAGYARLFAELGVPDRCPRSSDPGAVSRDGCHRRCARDHDRLLGDPEKIPRQRDVCVLAHGGEAQGRRPPRRRRLHAAALRSAVRARRHPGR